LHSASKTLTGCEATWNAETPKIPLPVRSTAVNHESKTLMTLAFISLIVGSLLSLSFLQIMIGIATDNDSSSGLRSDVQNASDLVLTEESPGLTGLCILASHSFCT